MLSLKRPRDLNPNEPGICYQILNQVHYHVYSVWLFTFSDLKTIVLPETAFGLLISISSKNDWCEIVKVLCRGPLVIFWMWINLLPFCINNQRHPASIAEDVVNKPWRTMPSKRWNSTQAKYAMIFFYAVAAFVGLHIGGLGSTCGLMVLGKLA